jgi:transcriptional regulator with XRE-family HTH domain
MTNKINNTNIYDTVRINIRKYRKLKGMTQQELADAADLSHGYIREIESLKMGVTFSLDAVEKIANALEIPFYLLFEEPTE